MQRTGKIFETFVDASGIVNYRYSKKFIYKSTNTVQSFSGTVSSIISYLGRPTGSHIVQLEDCGVMTGFDHWRFD